ncbi:hypothetical protein [Actinomadura nitritigenes]|uniref:hypothetical protein n=1 Tax=Actinomadura nitritigenes TaxID=134602 RepID=UPI003D9010AA
MSSIDGIASVRAFKGRRPLSVLTDPTTLWTWLPGIGHPDPALVQAGVDRFNHIYVAIGTTAHGLDGFRYSHRTVQETRRLLESPVAPHRVADYDLTQGVVLASQRIKAAHHLVQRMLGPVAHEPGRRGSAQ